MPLEPSSPDRPEWVPSAATSAYGEVLIAFESPQPTVPASVDVKPID
jgi:hypothetical protein